ncbi:MAG: hypothetical protein NUW37_14225 [Planctomycetes bacterium]|nr:hypothetical protein [Planctomycetota bacterium]
MFVGLRGYKHPVPPGLAPRSADANSPAANPGARSALPLEYG